MNMHFRPLATDHHDGSYQASTLMELHVATITLKERDSLHTRGTQLHRSIIRPAPAFFFLNFTY
jgi:hypothetical protein